jgi:hypothetical protein
VEGLRFEVSEVIESAFVDRLLEDVAETIPGDR